MSKIFSLLASAAFVLVFAIPRPVLAQDKVATMVKAGEYLARAGDCMACHTTTGNMLLAGGHPFATPFGTIFSTNITPDRKTGIGLWSADDFYRTMHDGRSKDGTLLYPVMPFGSYTKVTRTDSDAIFAYLRSVPAVVAANKVNELSFPYNNRSLLMGWRALFFRPGAFSPDTTKSAEWNRGAYLVAGLGHCAMCHSPINALGGNSQSRAFEGGLIPLQNWYAPSLTSNKEAGLGHWSLSDISDYLRNGVSHRGAVYGPMAEVVYDSMQYMTDSDTHAMAVYLKSLGEGSPIHAATSNVPMEESDVLMALGKSVYAGQCSSCHGSQGQGDPPRYPPLAGNQSIQMKSAVNAIRMVLNGGFPPGTFGNPRPFGMPPFAQTLSDEEVAAVVTYIRSSWGNTGSSVSTRHANAMRSVPLD